METTDTTTFYHVRCFYCLVTYNTPLLINDKVNNTSEFSSPFNQSHISQDSNIKEEGIHDDDMNFIQNTYYKKDSHTNSFLSSTNSNSYNYNAQNSNLPSYSPNMKTTDYDKSYINASCLDGGPLEKDKGMFIATQGPLTETIKKFWKLILQKGVTTILMLCKEFEFSKVSLFLQ